MHVVRFRIQDSCFKILTEHEDTKILNPNVNVNDDF